jgi:hypothetical protein
LNADLDAAREALEQGQSKRALRLAWSGAMTAIASNDARGLDVAIELAEAIRDRTERRTREEASKLAVLAAYARDHPQPSRIFGVTRNPR